MSNCTLCGTPVLVGRSDRRSHYRCEKELTRIRSREWYEKRKKEDKHFLSERSRKIAEYRNQHREVDLLKAAKERAGIRGLPFNITVEDIVIPSLCPVLGVPLERHTPYAPSVDRIKPELGYVKGNVQVISRKANLMKQDATPEELRRFAVWVKKSQL